MPDTTYTIPEHYPRQYSNVFQHQIQQMESRFKSAGILDPEWTAKEKVYRDLSQNAWRIDNTRFGETNPRETEASFRKGYKKKIVAEPIKFDRWDQELLDKIVLPTSEEMQAMMYGYERQLDDLFIAACSEDVLGGPEPHTTTVAFPVDQIIDVNHVKPGATPGANLGMTIWKLFEAKRMFESLNLNIDREEICLAVSPYEKQDLLVQIEAAGNEPWAALIADWFKQDAAGNKEAKLLGMFKVITTNRLPLPATDIRTCYAFCRSGFTLSPASDVKATLDRIPQWNNALLQQGEAMVGVLRRYDERVIAIPCDRSP